jgi:hypothetical protein
MSKKIMKNVKFVDGLTLSKIKSNYSWLLDATIENAVIGEDEKGIIFYSGNWIDGIWLNVKFGN